MREWVRRLICNNCRYVELKEVWECGGKRCGGYYGDGYRYISEISEGDLVNC